MAIDKIVSHWGCAEGAIFEALWKSGGCTWVPYKMVKQLGALNTYFNALGIDDVATFEEGLGMPPSDPQISLGCIQLTHAHRSHCWKPTRRKSSTSLSPQVPHHTSSTDLLTSYFTDLFDPPIPLQFINMPFSHTFVDSSLPDITVIDTNGVAHHVVPDQFWLYMCYNRQLQNGGQGVLALPYGYDNSAGNWNADPNCPYGFAHRNEARNISI